MDAGETFPNIKVGRLRNVPKSIVIDGRHTIEALKKRKVEYYSCDIYLYNSERELFADAVRFNAQHRRALNKQDEQLIMERLKDYEFTPDQIQKIIHVPASEIKRISFQDEKTNGYTVTAPGGRKTFIKTKIAEPSPVLSLPQIESRSNAPMQTIEFRNSLKHLINFLETNRLPDDAESREMIKKLRELMIIEAD